MRIACSSATLSASAAGSSVPTVSAPTCQNCRNRPACGRSRRVLVYTYSAQPELWWDPIADRLAKFRNLSVLRLDPAETRGLEALVERSMEFSCTIQDGEAWLRDAKGGEVRLGVGTIR